MFKIRVLWQPERVMNETKKMDINLEKMSEGLESYGE